MESFKIEISLDAYTRSLLFFPQPSFQPSLNRHNRHANRPSHCDDQTGRRARLFLGESQHLVAQENSTHTLSLYLAHERPFFFFFCDGCCRPFFSASLPPSRAWSGLGMHAAVLCHGTLYTPSKVEGSLFLRDFGGVGEFKFTMDARWPIFIGTERLFLFAHSMCQRFSHYAVLAKRAPFSLLHIYRARARHTQKIAGSSFLRSPRQHQRAPSA